MKRLTEQTSLLFIIILMVSSFLAISCQTEIAENKDADSPKSINSFIITSALNSGQGITSDCAGVFNGSSISISIPFNANVSNLTPTFTLTGQSVKIGTTPQLSGVSSNDFSTILTYTVYASDGSSRDYDVNINGNALGWIGGGSNGWKTGAAPFSQTNDYQSFNQAWYAFVDSSGNIYVADNGNHRICKWNSSGTALGWIGGGSNGWKTSSGPASSGTDYMSFYGPHGVYVDNSGNIYVADFANHRICKWDSSGNAIGWIGGGYSSWQTGSAISSGSGYRSFKNPINVFVDSSKKIYVSDYENQRVCKWNDVSGDAIGWIGGGSDGWKTGSAPTAYATDYRSMYQPRGLHVDGSGYIYVATSTRVYKWDSSGNAIGWIGGGSDGWKTSSVMPTMVGDYRSFFSSSGIYVDSSGSIYVAENGNYRISKWTGSGNAVGWIGGGTNGWKKTDAPNIWASDYKSFYSVWSVVVDSSGYIYSADGISGRITKWK